MKRKVGYSLELKTREGIVEEKVYFHECPRIGDKLRVLIANEKENDWEAIHYCKVTDVLHMGSTNEYLFLGTKIFAEEIMMDI